MIKNKPARICAYTVLTITLFLSVALILARFVFRNQIVAYAHRLLYEERLNTLRSSPDYDSKTTDSLTFTILRDSVIADSIYKYFRLDTIIKTNASTWNNAKALAIFVHKNIPHTNQNDISPDKRNAIDLWKYHKNGNRPLNCLYHAILLHELMLAAGITNRYVNCMPADSTDNDCHVVNNVWLPETGRWAMIDSDQGAYICDQNGTPLSLEAMRNSIKEGHIIKDKYLIRGKKRTDYISYWTKNLYWFYTNRHIGFGQSMLPDAQRVALIPEGFTLPPKNRNYITTSNPQQFWNIK